MDVQVQRVVVGDQMLPLPIAMEAGTHQRRTTSSCEPRMRRRHRLLREREREELKRERKSKEEEGEPSRAYLQARVPALVVW
jgi:hypothetical protein